MLIKRLAEESELKRRAEEEVEKLKSMFQKEQEQNRRLAENTKTIEEKCQQVTELARRRFAQRQANADKIAIVDQAEDELERPNKEATAYFGGLTNTTATKMKQPELELVSPRGYEEGFNRHSSAEEASDKTLPKKRPPVPKKQKVAANSKQALASDDEASDSKRKKPAKLKVPMAITQTESRVTKKDKQVSKATKEEDEEPNKNVPIETPKPMNRFLLPRRGTNYLKQDGESLDRLDKIDRPVKTTPRHPFEQGSQVLQKTEAPSEEEENSPLPVVTRDAYGKKKPEEWAAEAARRERDKELKKREKQTKVTLGEILRLKAEVEEVTQTLKIGEEARRHEEERGQQMKQELDKRLDQRQRAEARESKFHDQEEYMKTLRSAYEASSSDEERELERLVKQRQRPIAYNKYKPKSAWQDELQAATSNYKPRQKEEDSCAWTNSIIPKPKAPTRLESAGWCDTSEEEEANPFLSRTKQAAGMVERSPRYQPKEVYTRHQEDRSNQGGEGINLAGLTQEELLLINHMVEERIKEQSLSKPQRRPIKAQLGKGRQPPQYDERMLSLVLGQPMTVIKRG